MTNVSELGIPEGVREVIGRRLSRLSDGCNKMLTLASTMTGGFSWEALKTINADTPEAQLLDLLEEALRAQLVAERTQDAAGTYDFTHALIRQTLYGELSTPRRVLLHRQIGEALERLYVNNIDAHLPELAHHFYQAAPGGDVEKAIDYARRAGDRAVELLAYEDAAARYERALQALDLNNRPDGRTRYGLLAALGHAYVRADLPDKAMATMEQALMLAESLGDAGVHAEAAIAYFDAVARGPLAGSGAADPALERALTALGGADSAHAARLLARLSSGLLPKFGRRTVEECVAMARRAKEAADRSGDLLAVRDALGFLYQSLLGPTKTVERIEVGEECIRAAEQVGDVAEILQARTWRLVDLAEFGDMDALRRELPPLCDLADSTREPWWSAWRPIWNATLASMEGRYEAAERLVQQYAPIVVRTQHPGLQGVLATQLYDIRRAQGRLAELEAPLLQFVDQFGATPITEAALASLYLEDERLDEARASFERLAANDFLDVPADTNTLTVFALGADLSRRLRDPRRAALLYDILLPYANRQIVVGGGALCGGSASFPLALLASAMGRWSDAERHYEAALEFNEHIRAWPWLARTRHEYARMLHERAESGDIARTRELFNDAIAAFDEFAMKKDLDRALALKLELQGVASGDIYTSIDAVARAVRTERPALPQQSVAPDGTVTIMFSDIEDSTVLTERLGDQRWQEVLRAHNAIIRGCIGAHGGFEVKTMGDGFMVAFQSARRALECAIGIEQAIAKYNETTGEPVLVRVGLHAGEAIRESDDFYGRNVVLASRVAGEARGGEIFVSSLFRQLVASTTEIEFGEPRQVALKGLAGLHEIYPVVLA